MHCFITGSGGFIGYHLTAKYLKEGMALVKLPMAGKALVRLPKAGMYLLRPSFTGLCILSAASGGDSTSNQCPSYG